MTAWIHPEIIDLVGSSSDEEDDVVQLPIQNPVSPHAPLSDQDIKDEGEDDAPVLPVGDAFLAEPTPSEDYTAPFVHERRIDCGTIFLIDGEEVFIPDERPATPANGTTTTSDDNAARGAAQESAFTVDDCLQHVLEIFPDISHDYVRNLWASFENDYETRPGRARLDNIVQQLASASTYPKQAKGKLKRKRDDSAEVTVEIKKWNQVDRAAVPNWAKGSIAAICKADFPIIPRSHISERLATHSFLFQTYVALAKDVDDSEDGAHVFGRGRAAKITTAGADTIALNCGHVELVAELAAARLHVVALRSERKAAKAKKRAEEENLQSAIASGQTSECSACFDDLPMNRQIHCDGEDAHFTCFGCAERYIKSEVGDARCKVLCPAGCGAGFNHSQLNLLEDKQLLDKLAQIQQEQDIREAGLEDLESCPFCDYKVIMPPIEEDFEFRCANPECEKVSCRRCKAVSHVPITCEQHAKDNKLSSRHQIEEAMTAALVRSCVRCKKVFIKESGCNKMSCGSCGTLQCYVCSAVIKNYNHFDQGANRGKTSNGAQAKKCPLYDDVEERHEREVKEAETKARAEVVENNPDVTAEDLEIKVSEAVKKAETDRRQRGRGVYGGHYGFDAPLLRDEARPVAFEDLDPGNLGEIARLLQGGARPRAQAAGEAILHRVPEAERPPGAFGLDGLAGLAAQRMNYHHDQPDFDERRPAGEALRGYIPVFFPGGHHGGQAQPARQPAQPQDAQRPRHQGFPNFFGGMFDGAADLADLDQAPTQADIPNAQNNAFLGPPNIPRALPNLTGRPYRPYAMPDVFDPPEPPAPAPPPALPQEQPANARGLRYGARHPVFAHRQTVFGEVLQAQQQWEGAGQRRREIARAELEAMEQRQRQLMLRQMQQRRDAMMNWVDERERQRRQYW